jgi:hypothetical protein
MKKVSFVVTIEFADKITGDGEIKEVAQNIADSLNHTVNHGNGLAPECASTFTTKIIVESEILGVYVEKNGVYSDE